MLKDLTRILLITTILILAGISTQAQGIQDELHSFRYRAIHKEYSSSRPGDKILPRIKNINKKRYFSYYFGTFGEIRLNWDEVVLLRSTHKKLFHQINLIESPTTLKFNRLFLVWGLGLNIQKSSIRFENNTLESIRKFGIVNPVFFEYFLNQEERVALWGGVQAGVYFEDQKTINYNTNHIHKEAILNSVSLEPSILIGIKRKNMGLFATFSFPYYFDLNVEDNIVVWAVGFRIFQF